jgi:hypothetical protein
MRSAQVTSISRVDVTPPGAETGDGPSRFVQAHFWLTEDDVSFLRRQAITREQSVSGVIRSLLKQLRRDPPSWAAVAR